jgi:hypothetical protein
MERTLEKTQKPNSDMKKKMEYYEEMIQKLERERSKLLTRCTIAEQSLHQSRQFHPS